MTVYTESEEEITVVGYVPYAQTGEQIEAYGEYKNHKNYGMQFNAESVEITLPKSAAGILDFLSGGVIKGVGKTTAGLIVKEFGDKTLEILEHEPEKLSKIKGISKAKAEEIGRRYREIYGVKRIINELLQLEIEPYIAVKIYKKLGPAAVDFIRQNPYILCDEIFDLSFEFAEGVAKQLGIDEASMCRRQAGIEYVLRHNLENGHTFLPYEKLITVVANLLHLSEDDITEAADDLIEKGVLATRDIANLKGVYLKRMYDCEEYISKKLFLLSLNEKDEDFNQEIEETEKVLNIKFADMQKRAIIKAARSGVMVLTGGPGTGKTTTLMGIIKLFENMGLKVLLAAPTGRAAKRMSEVTGVEAKTIHRLLEVEYGRENLLVFARCENNPLDADVIIIDEASMVDTYIFAALLKAIPNSSKLIIVGDADQIPSVGAGNILKDIIKSELFETIRLTEIFRQARDSLIVVNAHTINAGNYPDCGSVDSDFFFVKRTEKSEIFNVLTKLVSSVIPKKFGLDPKSDIQVISPTRKGELGTMSLNRALQAILNPPHSGKKECVYRDFIFREGDKVMQVKNNYDITWIREETGECGKGIFNGDIGKILEVDIYNKFLIIDFDDRRTEYPFDNLEELETAYAITVHKSQGSEFPCVIMPVFFGPPKLCGRNLLYTAVTRAKNIMIMVGNPEALNKMVDNNVESRRYTGLKYLLLDRVKMYGKDNEEDIEFHLS